MWDNEKVLRHNHLADYVRSTTKYIYKHNNYWTHIVFYSVTDWWLNKSLNLLHASITSIAKSPFILYASKFNKVNELQDSHRFQVERAALIRTKFTCSLLLLLWLVALVQCISELSILIYILVLNDLHTSAIHFSPIRFV